MIRANIKKSNEKKKRRINRVRSIVSGTKERPRFAVYRSLKHVYAQIIDDDNGNVLVMADDRKIKKGTKSERASMVGKDIAKKAKEAGILEVVFDRRSYKYHGRIKVLADSAREQSLKF